MNKNIFLKETGFITSLWYSNATKELNTGVSEPRFGICKYQHLYITSSEEIKEGDWYIYVDKSGYEQVFKYSDEYMDITVKDGKKIILTTNINLISDGVQEVPDTFLQWLVNNPNCEYVEVIYGLFNFMGRQVNPLNISKIDRGCTWKYKIIIPEEKPKKYPIGGFSPGYYNCKCTTCKEEFFGDKRAVQCESCATKMVERLNRPGQEFPGINNESFKVTMYKDWFSEHETVEETAKKYALNKRNKESLSNRELDLAQKDFIAGVKWKQEQYNTSKVTRVEVIIELKTNELQRMYSEEEVKNLISKLVRDCYFMQEPNQDVAEWFKQSKKQ